MDNHFHLSGISNEAGSIPLVLAAVKRKYTLVINTRNGWTGSLWESRFHAYPMEQERFFPTLRYIERNPVRAGIVKNAEDYEWSSARAHVFDRQDKYLKLEVIENLIENQDWRLYLKIDDTADFIALIRRHEQTGRPFGTNRFIQRLERLSGRSLIFKPPGRKKK
jgi:putative transposase